MTAKNKNTPEPGPVTRDVKRTSVSADLAAKIRAADDARLAEFGFDLSYVVMARDGIVTASNSRDGYLPPLVITTTPGDGN